LFLEKRGDVRIETIINYAFLAYVVLTSDETAKVMEHGQQ
jgi:hypothetical protein